MLFYPVLKRLYQGFIKWVVHISRMDEMNVIEMYNDKVIMTLITVHLQHFISFMYIRVCH